MKNPFDIGEQIRKVASDGASRYQLGFAREKLTQLRQQIADEAERAADYELPGDSLKAWLEAIDYALGHITAVERRL